MRVSRLLHFLLAGVVAICFSTRISAQSSPTHSGKQAPASTAPGIDAGTMVNGVYRNKSLGLTCKIPAGWVLRTREMNAREESATGTSEKDPNPSPQNSPKGTEDSRVLLAAFSRPPEARGEDINASIVIAAESVAAYPGMTEPAQYFGPLTEVANAQGFTVDEEPYEFEIGPKKLVRSDFHKDVGARVMRQSTLAFFSHGYAISITVIGGTEDEVEESIAGVSFTAAR